MSRRDFLESVGLGLATGIGFVLGLTRCGGESSTGVPISKPAAMPTSTILPITSRVTPLSIEQMTEIIAGIDNPQFYDRLYSGHKLPEDYTRLPFEIGPWGEKCFVLRNPEYPTPAYVWELPVEGEVFGRSSTSIALTPDKRAALCFLVEIAQNLEFDKEVRIKLINAARKHETIHVYQDQTSMSRMLASSGIDISAQANGFDTDRAIQEFFDTVSRPIEGRGMSARTELWAFTASAFLAQVEGLAAKSPEGRFYVREVKRDALGLAPYYYPCALKSVDAQSVRVVPVPIVGLFEALECVQLRQAIDELAVTGKTTLTDFFGRLSADGFSWTGRAEADNVLSAINSGGDIRGLPSLSQNFIDQNLLVVESVVADNSRFPGGVSSITV